MHLNLHKTFSTPPGGGGPGSGPVAVKKSLEPFLPLPRLRRGESEWRFDFERPQSIGRVRAFYGNFGVLVRALAYILAYGGDGLTKATMDAVLNANYVRARLGTHYELPHSALTLHECVFSDSRQAARGVKTMDIAKRLIDYGFHPYTTAFPLIVSGALMIEPTESASKAELDEFIHALRSIAQEVDENPHFVLKAPYSTRVTRLDEATAARKPILRWKPAI
jgi:glycine dehydrogenase subunit 2